jgi:hypothetical protein
MRYRVTFLVGLGAGYILGTRAGREQYERMRRITLKIAKSPVVTEAVTGARGEVRQQWERLRERPAPGQTALDEEDDAGPSAGVGHGRLGRLAAHVPHTFGRRTHPAISHSHNGTSHPSQWAGDWTDGPDESDHMP